MSVWARVFNFSITFLEFQISPIIIRGTRERGSLSWCSENGRVPTPVPKLVGSSAVFVQMREESTNHQKRSERTSCKTPIPYAEELGLGYRRKLSSPLGSTWFQYWGRPQCSLSTQSWSGHHAHYNRKHGCRSARRPFLPVTRPLPSASGGSKAELGHTHREAPMARLWHSEFFWFLCSHVKF